MIELSTFFCSLSSCVSCHRSGMSSCHRLVKYPENTKCGWALGCDQNDARLRSRKALFSANNANYESMATELRKKNTAPWPISHRKDIISRPTYGWLLYLGPRPQDRRVQSSDTEVGQCGWIPMRWLWLYLSRHKNNCSGLVWPVIQSRIRI